MGLFNKIKNMFQRKDDVDTEEIINLDNIDTFGIQALYNTKFDTGD